MTSVFLISPRLKRWLFPSRLEFNTHAIRAQHGPQYWRDRAPIAFRLIRLTLSHRRSSGWRLWIYTPIGATHVDLFIDRRPIRKSRARR